MHGVRELVKEVDSEYEIVYYQSSKPMDLAVKDMGFVVKQIPYVRTQIFLRDALLYKYGFKPKDKKRLEFLADIKSADVVTNLYGICFTSKLEKGKYTYLRTIKGVIGKYAINFVAKRYGVKSVKCTASYGPITLKTDIVGARFAAKHIFDIMFAREDESQEQMAKIGIGKVQVTPDLANLMPYNTLGDNNKTIGISVSHQIIRQWNSKESYIHCIVSLINHIISSLNYKIILIPNEITKANPYHDLHVAKEIQSLLPNKVDVEILDVAKMSSSELKNYIASCEVMIASRYHACVAALSAGIPTLVIGWHYKYDELLKWYDQGQWVLSSEDCSSSQLITMFDRFWDSKEKNKEIIKERYIAVRKALLEAGKSMFSV